MKIQMRTTAAGPQGTYNAGQVYEVPKEIGLMFVDAGAAVEIKTSAPASLVEVEAPPQLTAEKALSARGKKK